MRPQEVNSRSFAAHLAQVAFMICFLTKSSSCLGSVSLLILPPYCKNADLQHFIHWETTLSFLLKEQLKQLPEIHVPPDATIEFGPDDSVEFAIHELGPRLSNDVSSVVSLGRVVEARKVLWSFYECGPTNWTWSARLVDTRTAKNSSWLTATSDSCWGLVCQMRNLILHQVSVKPTEGELASLGKPPTESSRALELTSMALYARNVGTPVLKVQNMLRAAMASDSGFALAREALAATYDIEQQPDNAAELLRPLVESQSASPRAHYLYAGAYRLQGLQTLAREQLQLAHHEAPLDPWPLIRLAEIAGKNANDWNGSVSLLKQALHLEFYNSIAHEEMGRALAHLGNLPLANEELNLAERFDSGLDGLLAFRLGDAYGLVGNFPKAIANYQRFLSGAARIGLDTPDVFEASTNIAQLRLRLSPQFVAATMPATFSPQDLKAVVEARLGPVLGRGNIKNPLDSDPDILRWATEATQGAKNDMDKAQQLLSAISAHTQAGDRALQRTAQQAAKDWRNPVARLSCEDYTFLYVAMARQVGLRAFSVLVTRDYEGSLVSHMCAGLFTGNRALLVDPAYLWFGIPHKNYQFLNDVEALGLYLSQSTNIDDQQCALKLLPGSALPRFSLAINLASQGRAMDARKMLNAGLDMDRTSWWSFYARGMVALGANDFDTAIKNLENCIGFHPLYPEAHFYLGNAYMLKHQLTEACEQYRELIEQGADPSFLDQARSEIARIGSELDQSHTKKY